MDFAGDRRGQSVVVGTVLVFGFLVLAFSGYQATVVPQQNERVEFEHSDRVQSDMTDLRSAILDVSTRPATRSVSVKLGTTYPSRSIFLNPNPPTGRLSTVDTTDAAVNVSIEHAESTDEEVGDFWDGSERTYNTGGIAYQPFYNYYDESAPVTVYENTVLFNRFGDAERQLSGQVLVDGREIRLVTLNGSTTKEGFRADAVDLKGASASDTRVTLTDDGTPINVSFRTTLSNETWSELLADEIDPAGYVTSITYDGTTSPATIYLEFESGVQYDLAMSRVDVGGNTEAPEGAYAVDSSGDGTAIPEGGKQQLVVEVRDAHNNPVDGVDVSIDSVTIGSASPSSVTTNEDGRATFEYTAPPEVENLTDVQVETSFGGGTASESATFSLSVVDADNSGESNGEIAVGSATADGPNSGDTTGVTFNVQNVAGQSVEITGITVEKTSTDSKQLQEGESGEGAWNREVFVDTDDTPAVKSSNDGYAEAGDKKNDDYPIGDEMDLTVDGDPGFVPRDAIATVHFYEFKKSKNDPISMTVETIRVTIEYEIGGNTKTFTTTMDVS